MADRPNVLFVLTDQHRGDAVGADPNCPTDSDGRRLVHTPTLDGLVNRGTYFSRAYSPAPTCLPARRCLWTGQTPATNGCAMGKWVPDEWDFEHTLPGELTDAGFQTHLVGKTHSQPQRNHFGFEGMTLHGGLYEWDRGDRRDDYTEWLDRRTEGTFEEMGHGLDRNSWDARPYPLEERYHPTNWTAERALEFLNKRDPTRPFFLTVSFHRPHQPFDPPEEYWDMYISRDLPPPATGEWSETLFGGHAPENPGPDAWCADLPERTVHRTRAGYYGLVSHVDHQLNRLLTELSLQDELESTLVVMTADHGEMLGDHVLWRKSYAYEGAVRVPMIVRYPNWMDCERGQYSGRPVGLEDVMPTILDAVCVDVPDTVEGRSLRDLARDAERRDWRAFYHGEHGRGIFEGHDFYAHPKQANHYMVDERMKYVWNPVTGREQLFDLAEDPLETTDLADDPDHASALERRRHRLVDHLADRPEGFSDGDSLLPSEGPRSTDG